MLYIQIDDTDSCMNRFQKDDTLQGKTDTMIDIKALKDSNEFLNLLLENINTAVFIADETLQIHQFNDSFLSIFSHGGSPSSLVDMTFGAASGCINSIRENLPCGETSACQFCVIKKSLNHTLKTRKPDEKKFLERTFYINGIPEKKFLEFTSQPLHFAQREMILVFVYDITDIELSKLQLEDKQRQIDIDLQKAGEIQKHLLPKNLPDIPSIRVDWFFDPCLTVGGDIFHVYREGDSHVSAYILDVCGHGVSAALIAVTVKQFLDQLHAQALEQGFPIEPVTILNSLEAEFPFERFDCYFTIAYVLINIKTGKTLYGCAGHVPPLIVGPDQKFEILDQHGTIIGLGQDPPLEQYETQLDPGDKVILYTDGLIDYFGKKGDVQNKDLFYRELVLLTDLHIEQIVSGIVKAQKIHQGDLQPDDDITLLVIEFIGDPSQAS